MAGSKRPGQLHAKDGHLEPSNSSGTKEIPAHAFPTGLGHKPVSHHCLYDAISFKMHYCFMNHYERENAAN